MSDTDGDSDDEGGGGVMKSLLIKLALFAAGGAVGAGGYAIAKKCGKCHECECTPCAPCPARCPGPDGKCPACECTPFDAEQCPACKDLRTCPACDKYAKDTSLCPQCSAGCVDDLSQCPGCPPPVCETPRIPITKLFLYSKDTRPGDVHDGLGGCYAWLDAASGYAVVHLEPFKVKISKMAGKGGADTAGFCLRAPLPAAEDAQGPATMILGSVRGSCKWHVSAKLQALSVDRQDPDDDHRLPLAEGDDFGLAAPIDIRYKAVPFVNMSTYPL